jgi:C4-type Zn-finger protein
MATAAKFVQPIPFFFGLSRSTRCGYCSYQVSSISVWRVTPPGKNKMTNLVTL